jgi:hypothetical protein
MSSAILFKEKRVIVEEHSTNLKYDMPNYRQKKYFLICNSCFWMASTTAYLPDICSIRYKKCPVCLDAVYRYLICDESF